MHRRDVQRHRQRMAEFGTARGDPRGRIPVLQGHRRRIGLSGDAVDLGRVPFDPAASLGRVLRQTGELVLCPARSDGRWVRGGGLDT